MSSNRVRTANWSAGSATTIPIVTAENAPVSKRTIFRAPKTTQEKVLCYTLCFLFVLMMVFLAALCIISERWKTTLSKLPYISAKEDVVCQTDACKETAQKLMSNIDPAADPCEDFYQYACGGWMERNPIPEGEEVFMAYDIRSAEVRAIVVDLLRGANSNGSTPRVLDSIGNLFRGCLDKDTRNKVSIESLLRLLKDMGGWPMVEGDGWSENGYNWYEHAARVNRELYMDVFIDIDLVQNIDDETIYSLFIRHGDLIFTGYHEDILLGTSSNLTTQLLESIIEIARLLGSEMDDDKLMEEAKEMIHFEYLLQKDSGFEPFTYQLKVEEIDGNVTGSLRQYTDFSYKEFLNLHIKKEPLVDDKTVIYMRNIDYFNIFPIAIDEAKPRQVANYISYWIVYTFASYTSENLWSRLPGLSRNWMSVRTCTAITKTFMSEVIGRLYIDKYFPSLTRYHVNKMIEMIRLAYSSTLDQNTWMDKNTMLYALVKLQSIESMVGYPEWIADDDILDKRFEKALDIEEDDYFGGIVKLCIVKGDVKYSVWNQTVKKGDTTKTATITVNAFYAPRTNFMILPAGILGYPFYKYNRLDSINYGGIGTVIGHEISHAFDDYGRRFDHEGKYRNWWTKETIDKFILKANCFEEQYENIVDGDHPLKVDGGNTLSENIADNGAIRNAFKAFRLHLALSDEDISNRKVLPGFPATPEQLFFLGYAAVWCANMTDEYARGFKDNDEHSPNKLRVNVPLANFKEFARAFKCKPGTPMNPAHKCVLW